MKNLWLYLQFGVYMIRLLLKKNNFKKIKRENGAKAAEELVYNYAVEWAEFVIDKVDMKVNVIGLENLPEGSCLYVGNHQSLLDIPVILAGIKKPMGFIAKKEMEKYNIISDWMKEIHCVFMDRSNVRESIKSINEGIENLKNGYSMVIFPEGTRSKGPSLGEFKKGSMKLGTKAEVPIVPITIDGTYKCMEGNPKNKIKSAEVNLIINKPIDPSTLSREEQNNLAEKVKEIIKESLDKRKPI
ncbi:lysophospholipid acyltransferase family protein [Clostridium peptidivorans]|uniref:lysophospholipid acyltransferase family protein n=1 Tax=Clostridium peptidivorans TaxID=100174 RepID=UPI000BE2B01C|nr:lysophospholipid acyltransferase family protein [Clostridium peptidivorans]